MDMAVGRARPYARDAERVFETHGDMLFRICLVILRNEQDAEDALSETLIKYMKKAPAFESTEHEKAWLIRVAANTCKDIKRYRMRHACGDFDDLREYAGSGENREALEAVMNLPDKYKTALYLFYVERYKTYELARLLGLSPAAVRKRLERGRALLKLEYEGE